MPLSSSKIFSGTVFIAVSLLAAWALGNLFVVRIRIGYALGSVKVFQDVTTNCSESDDTEELTSNLRYVMEYYPQSSRLGPESSNLRMIVEGSRGLAAGQIVQRLRNVAKVDRGADPSAWLISGGGAGARQKD